MSIRRLKELGILNGDIFVPDKVVLSNNITETILTKYVYRADTGDKVRYRGEEYVIVHCYFEMGGMSKAVQIVKLNNRNSDMPRQPIARVKTLYDNHINECELIRS